MGIEIERKFLVKNDQWRKSVVSDAVMKQGYVANQTNASVRVRIANGKAHLNIKSSTIGIKRAEFEYEIPLEEAEEILAQIAEQPFIDKTRYKVKCGEHIWELDIFEGANRGLIVAEIELNSEDEAFELPEWVGDEVSGDPKYYNVSLVNHPFNQW
ncbi:CYTH domain-containing protein [Candidatus Vondammii sp. HM_W22]|uniref:CYTH domain-containing protein n=1 Tax=Candidatus Vondammii sp. HM_W22 TaxID=2687299 RepID=UPI001F13FD5A|nr:CYTH domain-containing protein [Candidatus Vondammii sp. HM_W22]